MYTENSFEIGQRVFILDDAYCYDYENRKGFVGSWMFKKTGEVVDMRDEIYGEVNFGANYLIRVDNSMQWVAEECIMKANEFIKKFGYCKADYLWRNYRDKQIIFMDNGEEINLKELGNILESK